MAGIYGAASQQNGTKSSDKFNGLFLISKELDCQGEEDHEMFFIDSGKCEVLDDSITTAQHNHGGNNEVGPGQVVG